LCLSWTSEALQWVFVSSLKIAESQNTSNLWHETCIYEFNFKKKSDENKHDFQPVIRPDWNLISIFHRLLLIRVSKLNQLRSTSCPY
jgi:hypothetical protein